MSAEDRLRRRSIALAAAGMLGAAGAAAQPVQTPPEPRFQVTGFAVEGDNPLPEAETGTLLAPYTGAQVGLAGLQAAADALEKALRKRGYTFHRVTLPPQESAGVIRDPAELVKMFCSRFHSVARRLRLRGEYRATLSVEDECDAQDLLHALLRIQFDNIDTDEWTPSYSSGTPRTTLLLNDGRLAVIVKKTRPGLNAKDLSDQLQIDAERYRYHGRCTTLLCFVYYPDGRIGNPRGLEASLASVSKSFVIDVLVAPK